ncbi:UNVERIFIED_CONTAM: hypothetical protein FKN15_000346 [Acipenser sinensis]
MDLLSQVQGTLCHRGPGRLQMWVWPLNGTVCPPEGSQLQLSVQCRMLGYVSYVCLCLIEGSSVSLRTNPAFLHKVITAFHVNQFVELESFHPPQIGLWIQSRLHIIVLACPHLVG